jgi:SAM-dependent methyltransferase
MPRVTNEDIINAWSAASSHATDFSDEGDVARRHLLNPTIFSLIGDIDGKFILDAGCGQGNLSRLMACKGARVTGVEPADGWLAYAVKREQREQLGITYLQADLSRCTDLPRIFDVVVANMVFIDIPEYEPAMKNCIAAIKPGGRFIFSLQHPCFEEPGSAWPGKGYVEVREYLQEHVRHQPIGSLFHRPLSRYINLVLESDCTLHRIIEPQIERDVADHIGNDRDLHVPSSIVISAIRL